MTTQHHLRVFVVVVAALGTAACGSPPSRSGQPTQPVTLSSEWRGSGQVGSDVLADLVKNTADRSVRVTAPKGATYSDDDEGDILKAVQAGKFDVSVIRADRLAMAGATSLALLQTPFLVTTDVQAAKIAADPVADDLMAGLGNIGLSGIALVPGGLRHPFGYGSALLGPGDYRGAMINTRYGSGVDAIFTVLGATTDHSNGPTRTNKITSGGLRGIEVSFQQQDAVDRPAVVTSNVALYEKFDVVVVRSQVWDGLDKAQQAELRSAAVTAGQAAVAERDTESRGLERWCTTPGASSVIATAEDVRQLREALQPVIAKSTTAPGAAGVAARLAALGDVTTASAGQSCEATAVPVDADSFQVTRRGPQDVLDGVWRLVSDRQAILDAGLSPAEADGESGIWTMTIKDHIASVVPPDGAQCTWDFAFDDNAVSINFAGLGNSSCSGQVIGTFERDGDLVRFNFDKERDYDVKLDNAVFAQGMQKIG